ncbi:MULTISPECIES: FG-GAP repeat protein [unclassified Ensifer]|uniref:FG-GAP repeat protein n=1 Tax=unclassified Ensifer TaxID=2633371 RepID=UPI0008138DEA|nr:MULTISPECIES: FG-GAP repeat protein [unclassified Ensifer]OCP01246.1 hypothetical protein BC362_22630 [Ensifer sp. LC14]OCP03139.1 hypothetical protein BBX50_05750 [Ensifer sp. LC11]OCP03508.1 hypothetical protein BC374_05810 [Ensifer sp. LC13]OCP33921.1 hypothetical protein BC364_13300 [Ensifer sp. LC499]
MRARPILPLLFLPLSFLFPAAASAAETVELSRIVSAAAGDWNKDGDSDLALIVRPAEGSDEDNGVYLYLTGENGALELKSAIPNKIWGQFNFAGQAPAIEALPSGSLLITSHNDSIGRDRWEQTLTVAYRNFEFVVAGYTYSSYDTLDLDNTSKCDLNVLTGKGKSNDKPVVAKGELILFKDWNDDRGQKACGLQ